MRAAVVVLGGLALGCAPADGDDTDGLDTDAVDTDLAGEPCVPGDAVERVAGEGVALRFLAVDNGRNRLALVDEIDGGGWEVAIPPGARDLAVVGDEVLLSVGTGAVWLALADGAERDRVDGFTGVQSARPLADGGLLLGRQDGLDAVLTTLDAAGDVVGEVRVPTSVELRLVRPLPDGHVLLTRGPPYRVVEVDAEGAEVWAVDLPGKGYVAERWCGEATTYATTGADARLVALAADGAITGSWGGREAHADVGLDWASGFHLLPGGVAVVTNWLGHVSSDFGPHVVAWGPDDTLLWSWDPDGIDKITNVRVLAARGLP
ncbi:MAG: hypothetical protein H6732_16915 [Alphaproteobacteria bacterium]|nr:hypothetical protein [Alphaproteobacteria bacterium]